MAETVGITISNLIVEIAKDADFALFIRSTGDPFDPDDIVTMRFPIAEQTVTWTATIDPDDNHRAFWSVDETEVAALLAVGKPKTIRVHHERGESDVLWDIWLARVI